MRELGLLFKALSEPLRLRIIHLLLTNGKEAYGEELAKALQIPAYRLSRHLKVLKTSGLIAERREGRWVYYSLANRNGQLLRALRRLIAESHMASTNGRNWQGTSSPRTTEAPPVPSAVASGSLAEESRAGARERAGRKGEVSRRVLPRGHGRQAVVRGSAKRRRPDHRRVSGQRDKRHRQVRLAQEEFDWNRGPAIPGIL